MKQIDLFSAPSIEELIVDLVGPFEKFFVERKVSDLGLSYCKVLTKSKVYDISVFEGFAYESVINHEVDRGKLHGRFIRKCFKEGYL